jgi:hypothetical protein
MISGNLIKTKHLSVLGVFKHKWGEDIVDRYTFKTLYLGLFFSKSKAVGYGRNPWVVIIGINLLWVKAWLKINWKVKTFKMD